MKRRSDGFTLVEILVSLLLLSLVITPFISMFVKSIQLNNTSSQKDDAMTIAVSVLDMVYHMNETSMLEDFDNQLVNNRGYLIDAGVYTKEINGWHVELIISDESGLIRVMVMVFSSSGYEMAKLETLLLGGD